MLQTITPPKHEITKSKLEVLKYERFITKALSYLSLSELLTEDD